MKLFTKTDVPRLKDNQMMKGPDHFGCFNSGLQPTIRKAMRRTVQAAEKEVRYIVGPDLWGSEVGVKFRKFQIEAPFYGTPRKRIYRNEHGREVFVYKTRGPAVKKFVALCNEVMESNEADRIEYRSLKAKADKGDLSAAFAAGDMV